MTKRAAFAKLMNADAARLMASVGGRVKAPSKPKNPPPPLEHAEAVAFFKWVKLSEAAHPELRWLHAIPNGGDRNVLVGVKMKAEGVRKGVLDYAWPVRAGHCPGMILELKRVGLGKVSSEQMEWIHHYVLQGWYVHVCYGADEAIEAVKAYLAVLRVKNPQALPE